MTVPNTFMNFWLTGPYPTGVKNAVRGQSKETDERYEIVQEDGKWKCLRVVPHVTDDGWGFKEIPTDGTLFACMAAAEIDSANRWVQEQEEDQS